MPHTPGPWTSLQLTVVDGVLGIANPDDIPLVLAAPEMYALLKELEWSTSMWNSNPTCPLCQCGEDYGHEPDCRLAAVLKAVESE